MRELGVGGGVVGVVFRVALLAIIAWLAMWVVAVVLVGWAVVHVMTTGPRSAHLVDGSDLKVWYPTNWWAVAAAVTTAAGALALLNLDLGRGSALVLFPGVILSIVALVRKRAATPFTQIIVRMIPFAASAMLLLGGAIALGTDDPVPLIVLGDEVGGTSTSVVDVWATGVCLTGTEVEAAEMEGDIRVDNTVFPTVSSCYTNDRRRADPVFFLQASSSATLTKALVEGDVQLRDADTLRRAEVFRDGAILMITFDRYAEEQLSDTGFVRLQAEDPVD